MTVNTINIVETDPKSIPEDALVELSYEFERDGVTIRKTWTGEKSRIPKSIELYDAGGETVTFNLREL